MWWHIGPEKEVHRVSCPCMPVATVLPSAQARLSLEISQQLKSLLLQAYKRTSSVETAQTKAKQLIQGVSRLKGACMS